MFIRVKLFGFAGLLIAALVVQLLLTYRGHELAEEKTRVAENRYQSRQVAEEFRSASANLTLTARAFCATLNPAYRTQYDAILGWMDGKTPRPANAELFPGIAKSIEDMMRTLGFSAAEFAALSRALELSNELARYETQAFESLDAGRVVAGPATAMENETPETFARRILYDDSYRNFERRIEENVQEFVRTLSQRTAQAAREAEEALATANRWSFFLSLFIPVFGVLFALYVLNLIYEKMQWYRRILDAVPLPISVTDMNLRWTFVNKPVLQMLNVRRSALMGKHCSNWGAAICNTDKCGVTCLRAGKPQTFFDQWGGHFQVDAAYITDKNERNIGHIEVVRDITKETKSRHQEAELVTSLNTVVTSFSDATREIVSESQMIASSSTEQSSTIGTLSETVASLSEGTDHNVELAAKAMTLANAIKANAEKGSAQMANMTQAVKEISAASQSINDVMKVIDNIAFQTNLLALNAAVEAARAGQHGKGFAVVAEEVRALATKSAEAAQHTNELITDSTNKAMLGEKIASEAATSFADIVNGINESAAMTQEIATASKEQRRSISHVNTGISQFTNVVRQSSETAEKLATTSKVIEEQTEQLVSMVAKLSKGVE